MSYGSIFLSVQSFYVAKLFRNVGKTGYNAALDTHSAFLLVPNRNFLVTRSLFEYSLVMMLSDPSISFLPRLEWQKKSRGILYRVAKNNTAFIEKNALCFNLIFACWVYCILGKLMSTSEQTLHHTTFFTGYLA